MTRPVTSEPASLPHAETPIGARPSGTPADHIRGAGRLAGGSGLRRLAPSVLSGSLAAVSAIGLLATSGWLITRASERPPILELSIAIAMVQVFALGRGIFRYLQRLSVHGVALDVLGRVRLSLFDALEPHVPAGLPRMSTGGIVSGYVADAEIVAEGVAKRLIVGTDVVASVAAGVGIAALVAPRLSLVLLCGAMTLVLGALAAIRLGRRATRRAGELRATLAATVVDTVLAAPELVAFGRLDILGDRLGDVRRRSLSATWRRALAAGLAKGIVVLLSGAALIAVVGAGLALHGAGRLSGVMLAVVALVALCVFDQLGGLPSVLADLDAARSAAGALEELALLEPPVRAPSVRAPSVRAPAVRTPSPREPSLSCPPATSVPDERARARAALEDVSITLSGAAILHDVGIDLAAGHPVVLTGPSGSGKTTALHALLRFVGCESGRASVGGRDVAGMSRADIARRVTWMPADTYVFAADVRDNVRLARPDAPDASLVEVLEQVGLGEWLRSLPAGLATRVGTGGRPMSAGEQQRLGLARALLAGGDVVLLDEPTSHVDPASAGPLMAAVLDEAKERAVLVVSHDPETARLADEVVTLEGGRIQDRCVRPHAVPRLATPY